MADNIYDAIVVGSGISGGWAAKELTEKGLKVIMLERGEDIEHVKDYVNPPIRSLGISAPWWQNPANDQGLSGTEKRLSSK